MRSTPPAVYTLTKIANITFLVSYSGSGGVEVITNNLCAGLIAADINVTMLLIRNNSKHLEKLHPEVKQIKLRSSSAWTALPEITRYLKSQTPDVFIAVKDRAIKVAAAAKVFSGYRGLTVGQLHNNMIDGLNNRSSFSRKLRHVSMRKLYPKLDHIIAVSEDAAAAARTITKLDQNRVSVLPNAIVTPEVQTQSESPAVHRWLKDQSVPVIVGIGRLSPQKNFSLLINAFSLVLQKLDARLIIFGEGKLKNALTSQAKTLGIDRKVDLAGFVANPFGELKQASLFVLSSDWEGSPTVLTEALSLGVPCVATEVGDTKVTLQNGHIGPVCAPRDQDALAAAIIATLQAPKDPKVLRQAVQNFTRKKSTQSYLQHFDRLLAAHQKT